MRNQFPGICFRCGGHVKANEGHFERRSSISAKKWLGKDLPKWLVQHAECAIKYRGTDTHFLHNPAKEPSDA